MGRRTVLEMHGGHLPTTPGEAEFARQQRVGFCDWQTRSSSCRSSISVAYQNYDPHLATVVIPNAVEVPAGTPPRKPVSDDAPLKLIYIGRLVRA